MKPNLKIAATTILYNPDPDDIGNIYSYVDDVRVVYAVDNSEKENPEVADMLKAIEKVKYINNKGNLGVAKGLNAAAQTALDEGYDLLLTMDQDGKARPKMVATMLSVLKDIPLSEVGIISPRHIIGPNKIAATERAYDTVQTVMTSGNLLNLEAFQKTGLFNEELFIDCVDHDYCLRLITQGYKIIQSNKAIIKHTLGNQTHHQFLGKDKTTNNHSPLRRYYIARNRLYLMNQYKKDFPDYYKASKQELIKELKYIVLFEKEKLLKLKMMFKGLLDCKRTIMGEHRE